MDLQIGIWKIEEGEKEADRITIYPGPKTFDEASLQLPSGVYTTFRTYQRSKVLHPEYHLARLDNSARLAGVNIALNEAALRKAVYTILE